MKDQRNPRAQELKVAYIGGGSRGWAWGFMMDLAMDGDMCGTVRLYDIDRPAAERNQVIGSRISAHPDAVSRWEYTVCDSLREALTGADFVVISILPGSFDEMESDVHLPERLGIYQSVGDTAGPGGILRALRTVPIYVDFARAIEKHCPEAWVINYTNPMALCVRTLYEVFPKIKAFGCCHEVFNAEDFLCCVVKEQLGVERPNRHELVIDASGINHFTWITEARWQDVDVLSLLPGFIEKYYEKVIAKSPASLRMLSVRIRFSTATRSKWIFSFIMGCWERPVTGIWWNLCRKAAICGVRMLRKTGCII